MTSYAHISCCKRHTEAHHYGVLFPSIGLEGPQELQQLVAAFAWIRTNKPQRLGPPGPEQLSCCTRYARAVHILQQSEATVNRCVCDGLGSQSRAFGFEMPLASLSKMLCDMLRVGAWQRNQPIASRLWESTL